MDPASPYAEMRSRVDDSLLAALERYFSRHGSELTAVYLYGSIARGVAREGSDVDLGILVHEADSSDRIRFEVAVRNAYFDLQPILREYRRRGAEGL